MEDLETYLGVAQPGRAGHLGCSGRGIVALHLDL